MIVRFLGTGTSTGVPEIGCACDVCTSSDTKDKRLRSSVQVLVNDTNILIDCSPDIRQQLIDQPFRKIDAVLISHEHFDHVAGLEDLRPFCRFGAISVFEEPNVASALKRRMPYVFGNKPYGSVPDIVLESIDNLSPFYVDDVHIVPIRVMHHKLPILGYRILNFAYLTDLKTLPEEEMEKLTNLDVLVVSALRQKEHISHQTLSEAISLAERIGARKTYFTHMSHQIGLHSEVNKYLPDNLELAYDGLEIKL